MGLERSTTVDFSGDLQLAANGAVTFMRLRLVSLSCDIDFYNYPFDSQTCSVGFYPHGPPEADPVFNENNFDLNKFYTVHKEWLITSKRNFINNLNDKITNINVAVPTHSITMNRKPLYYVITIIFPMVVTSVMIPLVFMIPTQTGEKISYLIALFTSTAIFLNFIRLRLKSLFSLCLYYCIRYYLTCLM
ncbi:unnamed protein product [Candidula unifasciata]|uniref:Neurotransmitter-gated ion-channel ligand-binding domain-containing protein n=1 Tax=Candidula unifasciata TaxID=100452 RepID=A0A8S3ZB25_9EUPU|nr:unnamed protein product [Candidula unifasciata]